GEWLGSIHRAEPTGPGAAVSRDHESRRSFAPALPMVRAFGAFANGIQAQIVEQISSAKKSVAGGELGPQPLWQAGAPIQNGSTHWRLSFPTRWIFPTFSKTRPVDPCRSPPGSPHPHRSPGRASAR